MKTVTYGLMAHSVWIILIFCNHLATLELMSMPYIGLYRQPERVGMAWPLLKTMFLFSMSTL